MKVIYKYPLTGDGQFNWPKGTKVLSAGLQNGQLFLWALIDFDVVVYEDRRFVCVGDGHNLVQGDYDHVSTFLTNDGYIALHVLEWRG